MTAEEFKTFDGSLRRVLLRWGIAAEPDGAIVRIPLAHGSLDCGLQNLAQACHRADPSLWEEIIQAYFADLDPIPDRELEAINSDLSLARSLLRARLYSNRDVFTSEHSIMQQDLEGLVTVLMLGNCSPGTRVLRSIVRRIDAELGG